MSLLRALAGQPPETRSVEDAVARALREARGVGTWSGEPVTLDKALRHLVVWACINRIADTLSTFPIDEYEKVSGRKPRQLLEMDPILTNPNPYIDDIGWRRQVIVSLLSRGNSWGYILERDQLQNPVQAEILYPDDVQVRRDGKLGKLHYSFAGSEISPDQLWHVGAYQFPGSPVGLSPIAYAAEVIGLGRAVTKFGAQWFGDGAHPSSVIEVPGEVTRKQARSIKERFMEAIRGNAGPAVIGSGMVWKQVQVNPEESQFLETIQANGAFICIMYGLHPEDLGFDTGSSNTYANIEHRQIERLVYPISQWATIIERRMSALLRPERFVKINMGAAVRADLKTRTDVQGIRLRSGITSINEERELEDFEAIGAEGDRHNWPPYATKTDVPDGTSLEETNAS